MNCRFQFFELCFQLLFLELSSLKLCVNDLNFVAFAVTGCKQECFLRVLLAYF